MPDGVKAVGLRGQPPPPIPLPLPPNARSPLGPSWCCFVEIEGEDEAFDG